MARCKEVQKRLNKAWYEANKDHALQRMRDRAASPAGEIDRHKRTLKKYGITDAQWAKTLADQRGKCAGCFGEFQDRRRTHIDHCHTTGVVRGILCRECNLALGHVKDSAETLLRLAAYLHRNGG